MTERVFGLMKAVSLDARAEDSLSHQLAPPKCLILSFFDVLGRELLFVDVGRTIMYM